ncbi:hypothetical protein SDC9_89248 [bioreactor metagenome]|uniref:Uncharacterized protein n=1 Tax=bioreactor metagenome TaxID=1076179 RepID=A0A644ZP13_9ZZZZ
MFHRNVFVLHPARLSLGFSQNSVDILRDVDLISLPAPARNLRQPSDQLFGIGQQRTLVYAHFFKKLGDQAAFLL